MKNLLNHIQTSGELNKYWSAVDKLNDEARKAARKVERERKRIAMGSDYESSEDERKERRQEELLQQQEDEQWEREAEMSSVVD